MKQVLFICTGNIYRSKYAEAYFNLLAEPKINYRAISRGTMCDQNGSDCNCPPVSTEFWDKRIEKRHFSPTSSKLTERDFTWSDLSIGMYEPEHRPQISKTKTELSPYLPEGNWKSSWADEISYWMIPDQHRWGEVLPFHKPPEEGLRMIENQVKSLLDKLICA